MPDGLVYVKSDVWQVADGYDWTLSVGEWNERATGHANDAAGAYIAIDKVMTAWAAKHVEEIDEHGPQVKLLAIRAHADARPGFTN